MDRFRSVICAHVICVMVVMSTLMVTFDEAKANSLPINTTIYTNQALGVGGSVTVTTYPFYGNAWWKTAIMKTTTGDLPCEVWVILKKNRLDSTTWKNLLLLQTTTPNEYLGYHRPLWTLGRSVTLKKNIAEVFWHEIEYDSNGPIAYEQVVIVIDTIINGSLNMTGSLFATIP